MGRALNELLAGYHAFSAPHFARLPIYDALVQIVARSQLGSPAS